VGDMGLAIETLWGIASQESLGVLVQIATQEKSYMQSLKKTINKSLSGIFLWGNATILGEENSSLSGSAHN
jgi:hypothetical protein